MGNYVHNKATGEWIKEPLFNAIVSISGVTPTAAGRIPVDTELTLEGDIILEDIQVQAAPLTQVYISGVTVTDAGRIPVDTELTLEGDIILEDIQVQVAPLTEVHISGVTITDDGKVPVDTEITIAGVAITSQPPVIISGTQNALPVTDNSGSLTVDDGGLTLSVDDGGGSLTVDGTVSLSHPIVVSGTQTITATDLDIRDLDFAQDSVAIPDGVTVVSQPPVIISGTVDNLDVNLHDGSGNAITSSGGKLQVDTEIEIPDGIAVNAIVPVIISGTITVDANSSDVTVDNGVGGSAVNVQDGGNSLTVDGGVKLTESVVISGTVTVTGDAAGSLTVDNAILSVVDGGAESTAQRVTIANDSTGVLSIDDNDGSLTIDVNDGVLGRVDISGIAVHDAAAVTTGPQIMAVYDTTKPTAVADGDATRILADQYGRLLPGVEPERFQAYVDSEDATSATQIKAKTAANKMYVLSMMVSASGATAVQLQDDAGTPEVLIPWVRLAANGGFVREFPAQAPLVVATNQDLDIITKSVAFVTAQVTGYLAP